MAPPSVDPRLMQLVMAQGVPAMGGLAQMQSAKLPTPAPEGSWICIECQNVNYETRMVCNGKNCKKPRELVDGGPAPAGTNANRPLSRRQPAATQMAMLAQGMMGGFSQTKVAKPAMPAP